MEVDRKTRARPKLARVNTGSSSLIWGDWNSAFSPYLAEKRNPCWPRSSVLHTRVGRGEHHPRDLGLGSIPLWRCRPSFASLPSVQSAALLPWLPSVHLPESASSAFIRG